MNATEKFLRYIKIDTQSDPTTGTHPSTAKQFDLMRLLERELTALGLNVSTDEHGYLYSYIPSNTDAPAIGFIAHMDTEPVVSGTNVRPQIVEYRGGEITLRSGAVLSPDRFPSLQNYVGERLIVTDGTTLLGADDKAGVAEIMALAEYLVKHPEVKHGKIGIAFTPDEEIGEGADFFDVEKFGCDFAYTVDGGPIGELSYETFNAAAATFTLKGRNIHPGAAKGKMINCCLIAGDVLSRFPETETPATTEGREGFYHIGSVVAGVEHGSIELIIRDHDRQKFEERKAFVSNLCKQMQDKYGKDSVSCEIKDSYYNMREKIEPHMQLIENAKTALSRLGITPSVLAVRGGTDGARLSFMGLPCPNLGTGGHNCHSIFEFISCESLEKGAKVLKEIVAVYANA
ncbi:MAG: peptidase T [Clostridia bacterium]|nr:peptidase T [Clostridia bacterium]